MEAWTEKDKPNVGQWYRMRFAEQDLLRIRKDYRNQELKQTFGAWMNSRKRIRLRMA